MTRYDLTIQWTDAASKPGYQETIERLTIRAADIGAAFEAARRARASVTRVQIHGVAGTGVAFHGPEFSWSVTNEVVS